MAASGIALVAAFAFTAYATPLVEPGSNDPPTAERWVKATNKYRCMHGAGMVGWSEEASSEAQRYVNTLSTALINSNSLCLSPPAGPAAENLAKGYSNLEDAVKFWYEENDNCVNQNGCVPPGKNNLETRHYTAIVWKGVTQIGCAVNANASIYICRYRSGDYLGPQTANMPAFFTLSVFPETKDESACEATASGALDPSLPDPASLYPDIPDVGEQMSWVVCPNTTPGSQGAQNRYIRKREHTIALVFFIVVAVFCCCACCYSCRFIAEKKDSTALPGTLIEMNREKMNPKNEDWRWSDYKDNEKDRISEDQHFGSTTYKQFKQGVQNSGIFGGKE